MTSVQSRAYVAINSNGLRMYFSEDKEERFAQLDGAADVMQQCHHAGSLDFNFAEKINYIISLNTVETNLFQLRESEVGKGIEYLREYLHERN